MLPSCKACSRCPTQACGRRSYQRQFVPRVRTAAPMQSAASYLRSSLAPRVNLVPMARSAAHSQKSASSRARLARRRARTTTPTAAMTVGTALSPLTRASSAPTAVTALVVSRAQRCATLFYLHRPADMHESRTAASLRTAPPSQITKLCVKMEEPCSPPTGKPVCKQFEYCCPDAKHCLTPTKKSCSAGESCSDGQTCCPITKVGSAA